MKTLNSLHKKLTATWLACGVALLPVSALAHGGHSHAENGVMSSLVHTLMTHPLIFAVIGLLLVSAVTIRRK